MYTKSVGITGIVGITSVDKVRKPCQGGMRGGDVRHNRAAGT
ncbi:MAG: hypothetical protein JWR63_2235 [Conexibacter sp.]|nr:hypothetical protein [Conexibacter sp.]